MSEGAVPDGRTDNPYRGPIAFGRDDALYGRDREGRDLFELLVAHRVVLLYSPSGAGKTSLLQANLRPALEDAGFHVVPSLRVGATSAAGADARGPRQDRPGTATDRYTAAAVAAIGEALGSLGSEPDANLEQTLEGALARLAPGALLCLFFDQFEEIFTLDPTDLAAKRAFFDGLGRALRNRRVWAVFSMREEYIAHLDPYLPLLPTRLRIRYRLELLGRAAALEAVREPAADAGVPFAPGAAEALVDDLRRVLVQANGSITPRDGPFVEPVQLQVVCRQLWSRLPPDAVAITGSMVHDVGDVDGSLARYYAESVAAAARSSGVPEREVREWVGEKLISHSGLRTQVLEGPGEHGALVLHSLEDDHVLRADWRNAQWYELAHDRLIGPVRHDNETWFETHLSTYQRRARAWSKDQPPGLLLRGAELREAKDFASAHPREVTKDERAFLKSSKDAALRRLLARAGTGLVLVLAVVATVTAALAWRAYREADSQRKRAEAATVKRTAAQLRTTAHSLPDDRLSLRALLSQAADRLDPAAPAGLVELLGEAERNPAIDQRIEITEPGVSFDALWADQELTVVGRSDGRADVWRRSPDGQRRLGTPVGSIQADGGILAIARDPGSGLLALAGGDVTFDAGGFAGTTGRITLVDPADPTLAPRLLEAPGTGPVAAMVFVDGRLAVGRWDGTVALLDPSPGTAGAASAPVWQATAPAPGSDAPELCRERERQGDRKIRALAVVGGSRWLAAGTNTCLVLVWDLQRAERPIRVLRGHRDKVRALAAVPGTDLLLSTGDDSSLRTWNLGADADAEAGPTTEGVDTERVLALCVSPDGTEVTAAGRTGIVTRFDLSASGEAAVRPEPLVGHARTARAVACPSDVEFVSVAADSLVVWDEGATHRNATPVDLGDGDAVAAIGGWASPRGARTLAAVRQADGGARLLVLDGASVEQTVDLPLTPAAVATSPDGATVVVAGARDEEPGGRVVVFGADLQRPVPRDVPSPVRTVAVLPGGAVVAGGDDGVVRILAAGGLTERQGNGFAVNALAVSPDGRYVLSGDDVGAVSCFDPVAPGEAAGQLELGRKVRTLAVAANGAVAAGTNDDAVFLVSGALRPGQGCDPSQWIPEELRAQQAPVSAAAFGAGGDVLLSASTDGSVVAWEVETARPVATLHVGAPGRNEASHLALADSAVTVGRGSDLLVFSLDRASLRDQLCRLAARSLTAEEEARYLGATHAEVGTCPSPLSVTGTAGAGG